MFQLPIWLPLFTRLVNVQKMISLSFFMYPSMYLSTDSPINTHITTNIHYNINSLYLFICNGAVEKMRHFSKKQSMIKYPYDNAPI